MIDINKQYRTRGGKDVKLISVSARGERPVIGYIGDSELLFNWYADGCCSLNPRIDSSNDLIEVKPKRRLKRWLNVCLDKVEDDRDGLIAVQYRSREVADKYAVTQRIACLEIDIEFEEGQGL